MDYQKKTAKFDTAIEKAGLFPAYDKLNKIAEETLGTFLDDMIEQTVKEDCNGCFVSTDGKSCYFEDDYCPNCGSKMDLEGKTDN